MISAHKITGLVVVLACTFWSGAQAQDPSPNASTAVATVASADDVLYGRSRTLASVSSRRNSDFHPDGARVQVSMGVTGGVPLAQAAATEGSRSYLSGWALLLMGAFLIVTTCQRRYQAFSDR